MTRRQRRIRLSVDDWATSGRRRWPAPDVLAVGEEADHLLERGAVLPVDGPDTDDADRVGADVVLGLCVGELGDRGLALPVEDPGHRAGQRRAQGGAAGLERAVAAVAGRVRRADVLAED